MYGLVVRFDLAEGAGEAFDDLTRVAVAAIREEEPGTLIYACHAIAGEADARVFVEVYRDEAAFQAHEAAPHVREFHARKAPFLAGEPRVEVIRPLVAKGLPEQG